MAKFSSRLGFVQADVYDAPEMLEGGYDIVFVNFGSLNWLPDSVALGRGRLRASWRLAAGLYVAEQAPLRLRDAGEGRKAGVPGSIS